MAAGLALSALASPAWEGSVAEFEPCARYYEAMDTLIYLEADLPYRADRVDPFLTLLWHPQKEEAVGVKIKGFRVLFQCLQEVAESLGRKLDDEHFLPLVSALEMAMTAGLGAVITADAEERRVAEVRVIKYGEARKLITRTQVRFDARELAKAA